MRNFATLTKGDVISINYNDKVRKEKGLNLACAILNNQLLKKDYELCILETRPGNAVSIIECDMDVDFAPPVGYQEPKKEYRSGNKSGETENKHYKVKEKPAQVIEGYRLDGKQSKKTKCTNQEMDTDVVATTSKASGASLSSQKETNLTKGLPFYDYKAGLIRFNRHFPSPKVKYIRNLFQLIDNFISLYTIGGRAGLKRGKSTKRWCETKTYLNSIVSCSFVFIIFS